MAGNFFRRTFLRRRLMRDAAGLILSVMRKTSFFLEPDGRYRTSAANPCRHST
jgi:hypothetical protein